MTGGRPGGEATTRGLVMTTAGWVHYRSLGDGPPVVLLHINAQSSALMTGLMAELADRGLRAVAPDYPGCGSSDHVAFQPTIADYARWTLELTDALGIGSFAVAGEATGAFIAAEAAAQAPDRVTSLTLVNCPLRRRGEAYPEQVVVTPELRPADPTGFPLVRTLDFLLSADPVHSPMHPTQEWLDRLNTAQIEAGRDRWQVFNALTGHDVEDSLERVRCPSLVLAGDHFYLAGRVGDIAAMLPRSRGALVKDARFCATWERAPQIAEAMATFMDEHPSGAVARPSRGDGSG